MALGTFSGGGLGMGVAFVLEDYFSRTADTIERRMDQLGVSTNQMQESITQSMNQIAMGGAAMAVGIGLLVPLKKAMDVRADFQSYEVQFETLLKSADKAKAAIDNIKQDAIDSPVFGTKSLIDANASLISNGIEAGRARNIVNDLSNSLAAVGRGDEELTSMGVNLQGIASTGKAAAMDIKQFAIAGLPIYAMLQDATGKTKEELQDMDITLEVLEEAFAKATAEGGRFAGASERAANSTKGLKAAMEDGIELTLERIGFALEPLTRGLYAGLGSLLTRLREFAGSPIGQVMVRIVAVFAAFLVVGGLALVLMGGMRFAAFKLADAFGSTTKAKIIDTLVTQGLTAGLRQMAVAAWASLGPYVLIAAAIAAFVYIAKQAWDMIDTGNEKMVRFGTVILGLLGPIGWIIGAVVAIRRGFRELSEGNVNQGGLIGFFTKVAGVISGVLEIWESFNGETFSLSEDLASKLEAMGILDFVINLGTWIARIKSFFSGFVESLTSGFEYLKGSLGAVWDRLTEGVSKIFDKLGGIWDKLKILFAPVISMIGKFLEYIGLGKGGMDSWASAGKIMGNTIILTLEAIIWVLGVIIDVIIGVIDAFLNLVDMVISGVQWIVDGINWIIDGIVSWMDFMYTLGSIAYDVGANFISSLWEGMKAIWESVATWLSDTIGGAISSITDALGITSPDDPEGEDGDAPKTGPKSNVRSIAPKQQGHHYQSSKSPTVFNSSSSQVNQSNAGPTIIQNYMDGDLISEKVIEKQELSKARA